VTQVEVWIRVGHGYVTQVEVWIASYITIIWCMLCYWSISVIVSIYVKKWSSLKLKPVIAILLINSYEIEKCFN